jgi:HD-like signal output (HDOD) protein
MLPTTAVQLDSLLGQPVMDLTAITATILTDVGATLQVFRFAAHSLVSSNRRLGRIDDCVVHLGRRGLRTALSLSVLHESAARSEAICLFWKQAEITAMLSQIASDNCTSIHRGDAYLAGLLQDIGRLPELLGWNVGGIDVEDPRVIARALVREWRLPSFLNPVFRARSSASQGAL